MKRWNFLISMLIPGLAAAASIRGHVNEPGLEIRLLDGQGKPLKQFKATPDAAGNFTLDGLPPGDYRLKADAPLPPKSYLVDEYWSGAPDKNAYHPADAALLKLADPNASVAGIELALERGGSVAGRIVEAGSGKPLEGIDLDAYDAQHKKLPFSAKTKADGSFQFKPMPPGAVYLKADAPAASYYVDQKRADAVLVESGKEAGGLRFELIHGGLLTGRVSEHDTPLNEADLDLYDQATGQKLADYDAKTGPDGRFRLGPVPPGVYLLKADPPKGMGLAHQYYKGKKTKKRATPIQVAADKTLDSLNFSLRRKKT